MRVVWVTLGLGVKVGRGAVSVESGVGVAGRRLEGAIEFGGNEVGLWVGTEVVAGFELEGGGRDVLESGLERSS